MPAKCSSHLSIYDQGHLTHVVPALKTGVIQSNLQNTAPFIVSHKGRLVHTNVWVTFFYRKLYRISFRHDVISNCLITTSIINTNLSVTIILHQFITFFYNCNNGSCDDHSDNTNVHLTDHYWWLNIIFFGSFFHTFVPTAFSVSHLRRSCKCTFAKQSFDCFGQCIRSLKHVVV